MKADGTSDGEARTDFDRMNESAIPVGWKSQLYPDRYQIVAIGDGEDLHFCHLHQWTGAALYAPKTFRDEQVMPNDGQAIEVYISGDNVGISFLRQTLANWLAENRLP